MQFPRVVIPISVALTALLNLFSTLVAVFIFAILAGAYPTWSWFELIPLIGLLTIFATGVGMLLSVLYVRYRDIQPIWEVVTQMLFYASPILYVATMVQNRFGEIYQYYLLNPIAFILTEIRHAVVDPNAAGSSSEFGMLGIIFPLLVVLVVSSLGVFMFLRQARYVAEEL